MSWSGFARTSRLLICEFSQSNSIQSFPRRRLTTLDNCSSCRLLHLHYWHLIPSQLSSLLSSANRPCSETALPRPGARPSSRVSRSSGISSSHQQSSFPLLPGCVLLRRDVCYLYALTLHLDSRLFHRQRPQALWEGCSKQVALSPESTQGPQGSPARGAPSS